MRPSRTRPAGDRPFWHGDASERMRALLPELLVSIVATGCLSAVTSYTGDAGPMLLLIVLTIVQIFVQGTLYVFTYLGRDERSVLAGALLMPMVSTTLIMVVPFFGALSIGEELMFGIVISIVMGETLFWLTRTVPGFVLLIVEVIVLSGEVSQVSDMALIHVVGLCALMALYVMRRSATRITRSFDAGARQATDAASKETSPRRNLFVQVALLCVLIAALCAALGLGEAARVGYFAGEGTVATSQAATEVDPEQTDEPAEDSLPASASEAQVDETQMPADEQVHSDAPEQRGSSLAAPLLLVVLLAMLAAPLAACLLKRRLTRRSLEREQDLGDRAARIYLAVLGRLKAAGIRRGEDETPRDFLVLYEEELVELTAPASIGIDDWAALTSVYVRARYAGLEPTSDELDTCWRIYDALPACARASLGWRRYFMGAFWHM